MRRMCDNGPVLSEDALLKTFVLIDYLRVPVPLLKSRGSRRRYKCRTGAGAHGRKN